MAVWLAVLLSSSATLRAPTISKRHRRPTTGLAQQKRIAWGNMWGAVAHEESLKLRGEREEQG